MVLFKRHANTLAELHTDKRHSFRPRLNMRFLLSLLFASIHPPPSPLPTLASTYSSAPRSLRSFIHATFPSLCTGRRGNNKDRGHVYHTLLDTGPLPPRTSLRAAPFSSIQRCSFRSRMQELCDTRDVLKKKGREGGGAGSGEEREEYDYRIRLLCIFQGFENFRRIQK